jgi:hypothetical protein
LNYSQGSTMHRLPEELPNNLFETMVLHNSDDDPGGIRARQHFISSGYIKRPLSISRADAVYPENGPPSVPIKGYGSGKATAC